MTGRTAIQERVAEAILDVAADLLARGGEPPSMADIAEAEIELAQRQYMIARHDSTIGYEASNHYYYRPLDLLEKVLNCREVIDRLRQS